MDIELLDEPTTALTVQDRAALAMGSSKTEQDLKALAVKNVSIVAIVDRAGREQAHGAAMELKRARTAIASTAKTARDDATKFSRAVIDEEKRLIAIIEPEEVRILSLRDAWDSEQARIKEEAERIERQRITAIHERIGSITAYHALALECRTADRVHILLEKMEAAWVAFDHETDFAEFGAEAQSAYIATSASLAAIIEQKRIEDAERAAVKAAQAAEAARLAEERAATEAAAKKLADERAAFEAEQAAFRATQAAAQASAKAEREAAERAAAEQKAKDEADAAARELEAYAAAISAPVADVQVDVATVEPAPVFADTVVSVTAPRPRDKDMVNAVADAFNVDYITALDWMESIDFHELNR